MSRIVIPGYLPMRKLYNIPGLSDGGCMFLSWSTAWIGGVTLRGFTLFYKWDKENHYDLTDRYDSWGKKPDNVLVFRMFTCLCVLGMSPHSVTWEMSQTIYSHQWWVVRLVANHYINATCNLFFSFYFFPTVAGKAMHHLLLLMAHDWFPPTKTFLTFYCLVSISPLIIILIRPLLYHLNQRPLWTWSPCTNGSVSPSYPCFL